jgi:hypothetical protein
MNQKILLHGIVISKHYDGSILEQWEQYEISNHKLHAMAKSTVYLLRPANYAMCFFDAHTTPEFMSYVFTETECCEQTIEKTAMCLEVQVTVYFQRCSHLV